MLSLVEKERVKAEINFSFAKSSGPGGQHVNKTNSKVVLIWDLNSSEALSEEKKDVLKQKTVLKFPNGKFLLSVEETRSQYQNKEIAIIKLFRLIDTLLYIKPIRKKTKIKKSDIENRLKQKKKLSFVKITRKKPKTDWDD